MKDKRIKFLFFVVLVDKIKIFLEEFSLDHVKDLCMKRVNNEIKFDRENGKRKLTIKQKVVRDKYRRMR